MRVTAWIAVITNVIVFAGLIVYFTVVALNLTFTFTHLTVDDVPFYDNPTDNILGESLSERYHLEYWVYASDFLRFIPPILLATVIGLALVEDAKTWAQLNVWTVVILIILEIFKLAWRLVQYGFCDDFQFCRPFDPLVSTSGFGPTNFIWQWTVWGNAAWIVVLVVYLIIATQVESGSDKFWEDLSNKPGRFIVTGNKKEARDWSSLQTTMLQKMKTLYKLQSNDT